MAFTIHFSEDAERHLRVLTSRDRATVIDAIDEQLTHQPNLPTRRRKLLRPTPLATWELRVGNLRVFYNVDEARSRVAVVAFGVKTHNVLFLDGKEYQL